MVLIPGGSYDMGSADGYREEAPVHRVTVPPLHMDRDLVTNAEFKRFCDETGTAYPDDPRWNSMPGYFLSYPDHPVINVSHGLAGRYARWAGKRLPTEEEWEYAAAGGMGRPSYPWGDALPNGETANFADRNTRFDWRDFRESSGFEYTSPVGRFQPNGYGLYDMAGNVWQWCEDWFFEYTDHVRDTSAFADGWGGSRVCRGGCYHSSAFDLRIARRRRVLGGIGLISVGFRCVKDVDPETAVASAAETDAAIWDYTIDDVPPGRETTMRLCLGVPMITADEAKAIRKLGFTSVEQYVTWETVENAGRDAWDFSVWDEQVELIQSAGLKWVPFLIAGPAYSLPDWFRASREFAGLVCLEHQIESRIETIWDPAFRTYVDRFVRKVAEHYAHRNVVEAVLIGITGDFGEAIFPDWHGNWTTQIPGLYHSHAGYWAGDTFARDHFIASMRDKYTDIRGLNRAWDTSFASFAAVRMPELHVDPLEGFRVDEYTRAGAFPVNGPAEAVRWLDFIDWYRFSMTEFAGFWLMTTRRHFPDDLVYLCTGGNAIPYHGADFAQQCKIAAEHGCGVRITNEASNYARNFTVTNWVASAGRRYGAYFGFEPAGKVTERGIVCRIYNATAVGAEELHYYKPNVLGSRERADVFVANLPHLYRSTPIVPIAAAFPDASIILGNITSAAATGSLELLRDYTDYRFVDDLTIEDGILEEVACLVICGGELWREKTLDRIQKWVRSGGVLVAYNVGSLRTAETGDDYGSRLLKSEGGALRVGSGASWYRPAGISAEGVTGVTRYQRDVFDPLTGFLRQHNVHIVDGVCDNVFCSETESAYLVLNMNDDAVSRKLSHRGQEIPVTIAGSSILNVSKPPC